MVEKTTVKTVAVFVIMFGCFAVLYPKIFHPMILNFMGYRSPEFRQHQMEEEMLHPRLHPRDKGMKPPSHAGPNPMMQSRPGVHPGMRAAAEMRKQAAAQQQGTGGRGMVGYMLPLYAVGIIIYLVYTMSKVFVRGEEGNKTMPNMYQGHFASSANNRPPSKERDAAENEMNLLRKRLEETESQMNRILQAMEAVKQKVPKTEDSDEVKKDETTESCKTDDDKINKQQKKAEIETLSAKKVPIISCDSSPDMETYDIINKNDKKQSPDSVDDSANRGTEQANRGSEQTNQDSVDSKNRGSEQANRGSERMNRGTVRENREHLESDGSEDPLDTDSETDYTDNSSDSEFEDEDISSDMKTLKRIKRHLESVAGRLGPEFNQEDEEDETISVETIAPSSVAETREDGDQGLRKRNVNDS